jgi:glycogen operon protein
LASVNFVTAHDGFTLRDLVSYDVKHNLANGEQNRDGADTNRSFNHGAEGPTDDPHILATRRKAIRNLLGTLLLSAGIPMLTAGDEFGRTQRGNNNAYCHDSTLTWLSWDHAEWQQDLQAHVRHLIALRHENPALRPSRFAVQDRPTPSASVMDWYDESGAMMSIDRWTNPAHRTLQYVAASTPEFEAFNRILLMVHGNESPIDVTLPDVEGVTSYVELWSSIDERPSEVTRTYAPGDIVPLSGTSMRLFRAE